MDYIEVNISLEASFQELMIAELGQIGYETFIENDDSLQAYIPEVYFQKKALQALKEKYSEQFGLSFETKHIPEQNWNAVWEADYAPVIVDEQCLVRSEFHQIKKSYPYDILINPKMSFGTGHHETTTLMLRKQLSLNHEGQTVLDAGCGTGILAIMAEKRGAKEVLGIDIDEWAVRNSIENIQLNACTRIEIRQSQVKELEKQNSFQIILANINKNTLLEEIIHYAKLLEPSGHLILSGFYRLDLSDIQSEAQTHQLYLQDQDSQNDWHLAHFVKQ